MKPNRSILLMWGVCVGLLFWCSSSATAQQTHLSELEEEITQIVEEARPAVVTILASVALKKAPEKGSKNLGNAPGSDHYTYVGSGLYLNEEGYIATRASVVSEAEEIRARFWNGDETRADLIGIDDKTGVALLRIDSPVLSTLPAARPATINPGAWIFIIGNALGVSHAVNLGNISAVYNNGFVQISAHVEPGANGAPVLSANGHVIGILSGRLASNPGVRGANDGNTALVTPIEEIYKVSRSLLQSYNAKHGWIGLSVRLATSDEIQVEIIDVDDGSPAKKAGLMIGDIVVGCKGRRLDSYYYLKSVVQNARPGDALTFQVLRSEDRQDVSLKVGQRNIGKLFLEIPYASDDFDGSESKTARSISFEKRLGRLEKEIQSLRTLLQKRNR